LYSVLSLLLTWPLARHFTTHTPGDGIDDPALAWNLWWIKTRLVDQLQLDIFHTGWMFHPIEINLAFYTLTPLNGLLSVPLQTALTLVVANNLVLLSSFVLGGYGAYLLCRTVWPAPPGSDERVYQAAALCAGVLYGFASSKLFYAALGQFNIASSQWIPFCLLYLWRLGRSTTMQSALRNGLLAGLFLAFQIWAELTFASFLLLFTALFAFWQLVVIAHDKPPKVTNLGLLGNSRSPRFVTLGPFLTGLAVMGVVFGLALLPFLAAMLPDLRQEGDFFTSGGGFAEQFSADLVGLWLPTRLHPLWGEWVATLPFPNDKGQQLALSYAALAAAATGVITGLSGRAARAGRTTRNTTGFWLLALLVFTWLSLGPWLHWAGQELPIPGPFALVSRLPFFSGNRYPSRYGVLVLLCLAVLAAQGLIWLGYWARQRQWPAALPALLVGLLFLAEQLAAPLPLSDFRIPAIYDRLAAEPGDFAVLELPTGWRNGARVLGRSDVLIMRQQWYQTAHAKRRLGGNTSRNPEYKFQYFTETPLLGDLIALMNADRDHLAPVLEAEYPAMVARAQAQAAELLDFLEVRYVTLHVEHAPALLVRYVEEALPLTLVEEWQGPDWNGAPSTIRLYQVDQTGPSTTVANAADLAIPEAHHHLGEGWSAAAAPNEPRFSGRSTPLLLVDLPPNGGELALILPVAAPVRYTLNDVDLAANLQGARHILTVPDGVAAAPVDRLSLTFLEPPAPVAALAAVHAPQGVAIGGTGVRLDPGVALVVRSAGEEVGNFAHILVNGQEAAPNQRGYNLVALAPNGDVIDGEVFDTFQPREAARLAAWVAEWPPGTIIAGAVADEASLNLTEEAVAALHTLGVAGDLRGKFRWSHAFLGAAGATPGAAQEALSLIQPATLYAGLPADTPQVTGGVVQLGVTPN
jgi:hypothetical protein